MDSARSKQGGKVYIRHLLRKCYREDGKVKHKTIANISHCSPGEIEAIRLALRHKKELSDIVSVLPKKSSSKGDLFQKIKQGLSLGAVWLVYDIARQLGIVDALGSSRYGKLALWQIIARVIDHGSRLSAIRLAGYHAACDVLGVSKFDEDDLYSNLDWLCERQSIIEDRLFNKLPFPEKEGLFLYDVTSSYLEGCQNELSAFGYNRDGKSGKRQIVIGLLCNECGVPLSIEVFTGNTQDPKTFGSQIKKAAERFGRGEVTFVGDRGMIKSNQIKELGEKGFHYITAITKPQMEKLINDGVFQLGLFEQTLAEVIGNEGIRYILRRNPVRAEEVAESRKSKLESLCKEISKQNKYLVEHPRARVEVSLRKVNGYNKRLKLMYFALINSMDREISLFVDEDNIREESELDGCYVIKTDLPNESASKETVHNRYKDLALVESAFRRCKTVELEVRPVHVRLASRTRGHAFVVMMAYRIIRELGVRWREFDITVDEGIKELSTLCCNEVMIKGKAICNQVP